MPAAGGRLEQQEREEQQRQQSASCRPEEENLQPSPPPPPPPQQQQQQARPGAPHGQQRAEGKGAAAAPGGPGEMEEVEERKEGCETEAARAERARGPEGGAPSPSPSEELPRSRAAAAQREHSRLFVSGLRAGVSLEELREYFERFGEVEQVRLPTVVNHDLDGARRPRGYAFVTMVEPEVAAQLVAKDGHDDGMVVAYSTRLPKSSKRVSSPRAPADCASASASGPGSAASSPARQPGESSESSESARSAAPAPAPGPGSSGSRSYGCSGYSSTGTSTSTNSSSASSVTGSTEATDANRIFVGGLAAAVTAESLADYFGQFGSVLTTEVMIDRETNRSRGFGFVAFSDDDAVRAALAHSEHIIMRKKVEVKRAVSRETIREMRHLYPQQQQPPRRGASRSGSLGTSLSSGTRTPISAGSSPLASPALGPNQQVQVQVPAGAGYYPYGFHGPVYFVYQQHHQQLQASHHSTPVGSGTPTPQLSPRLSPAGQALLTQPASAQLLTSRLLAVQQQQEQEMQEQQQEQTQQQAAHDDEEKPAQVAQPPPAQLAAQMQAQMAAQMQAQMQMQAHMQAHMQAQIEAQMQAQAQAQAYAQAQLHAQMYAAQLQAQHVVNAADRVLVPDGYVQHPYATELYHQPYLYMQQHQLAHMYMPHPLPTVHAVASAPRQYRHSQSSQFKGPHTTQQEQASHAPQVQAQTQDQLDKPKPKPPPQQQQQQQQQPQQV